jgi:putative Mn2+ efflux pump MntP
MEKTTFGVLLIGIGVVMIVKGLSASHLYNDTEGPLSEEATNRSVAKPRDRLFAVCVGALAIGLGIYNLSR